MRNQIWDRAKVTEDGKLFRFGKKEACQLSFSRLLTERQREKSGETGETGPGCRGKKKRKYKFLREITLEENIAETENNFNLADPQHERMFQCSKCNKNYKFASGLHYHTKHYH